MGTDKGFLAIWSDVDPRDETSYLHWLTREHTAERLSVPGFLGTRVFRARVSEQCRYLILYDLEDPSVVGSEAYLERLNAPSEWSRRIMPILQNFVRGGGRVVAEAGSGQGATILPIFCQKHELAEARVVLGKIAALDRVVAARLFETERSGTEIATNEKSMRRNDQSFPALLLIEVLSDEALQAACDALRTLVQIPAPAAVFDQIFALDRDEIRQAEAA